MGYLQGLKGVNPDREIDCLFIECGSEITAILRNNYAAIFASGKGSLHVWVDDSEVIRAESMRYLATLESKTFENISDAIEWVDLCISKLKC